MNDLCWPAVCDVLWTSAECAHAYTTYTPTMKFSIDIPVSLKESEPPVPAADGAEQTFNILPKKLELELPEPWCSWRQNF